MKRIHSFVAIIAACMAVDRIQADDQGRMVANPYFVAQPAPPRFNALRGSPSAAHQPVHFHATASKVAPPQPAVDPLSALRTAMQASPPKKPHRDTAVRTAAWQEDVLPATSTSSPIDDGRAATQANPLRAAAARPSTTQWTSRHIGSKNPLR